MTRMVFLASVASPFTLSLASTARHNRNSQLKANKSPLSNQVFNMLKYFSLLKTETKPLKYEQAAAKTICAQMLRLPLPPSLHLQL